MHSVVIELLRKASFKWIKEHGSIYRVWFTLRPMVVIAAPELLEVFIVNNIIEIKIITIIHEQIANFDEQHADHQSNRVRLFHSSTRQKFGRC